MFVVLKFPVTFLNGNKKLFSNKRYIYINQYSFIHSFYMVM